MIAILGLSLGVGGDAIELAGHAVGSGTGLVVARVLVAILVVPVPVLAASELYFELRGRDHASDAPAGSPTPQIP